MGSGGQWSALGLASRTVLVTAAQIKNLRSQPITLLGPVGSGFSYIVLAAFASLRFGSQLFVSPFGQAVCAVAYLGAIPASPVLLSDDFSFLLTAPQVPNGSNPRTAGDAVQISAIAPISVPDGLSARNQLEGAALVLSNNGSSDFTNGDSDLLLTVLYFLMPL